MSHIKKFETIESLRGMAAIVVAVFHFSSNWGGYLAVDFFFVLSGFILSHSYLYKHSSISFVEFISHRISRLYPLHFFTLFTFIITFFFITKTLPQYGDGNFFTFIQNLMLVQNIGFNPRGITYNYPSWSVSVEFWINMVFIVYIKQKTKNSTLFFLALIGLIVIYANTGHLDTHAINYFKFINSGIIRGISSFLLGILSYRIYLYYYQDIRIKKYINYMEIICVVSILIIVFGRSEKFSGVDMFAPFLFMLAIAVFALELGVLSNHLKKYKYLGEISYSIYLNQITVLMLVKYAFQNFEIPKSIMLFLAIYLVMLITYSHFTYQYIEKPLRKKGRKIFSHIFVSSKSVD